MTTRTTSPASGATVADLLGQPLDGVARLVLRHQRMRAFRWMFVVEVVVALLLLCCLLPVVLLALLFGRDVDVHLPELGGRMYNQWQEVALELIAPDGTKLGEVRERPAGPEEGDALVGSILAAAAREKIVVVQVIGRETAAVWYGGQPLLAAPVPPMTEEAERRITEAGGRIERASDVVQLTFPVGPRSKVRAALGLLLLGWCVWIAPIGRRYLRDCVLDLRGEPWPAWLVEIRAESLALRRERLGELHEKHTVSSHDLLGIAWCASLGFDTSITRKPPHLRWVCRRKAIDLPFPRDEALGEAVRELMVVHSRHLRSQRPELGLLGDGTFPGHCPYCATLYTFEANARCPSCGAPCTGFSSAPRGA